MSWKVYFLKKKITSFERVGKKKKKKRKKLPNFVCMRVFASVPSFKARYAYYDCNNQYISMHAHAFEDIRKMASNRYYYFEGKNTHWIWN